MGFFLGAIKIASGNKSATFGTRGLLTIDCELNLVCSSNEMIGFITAFGRRSETLGTRGFG